MSSSRKRSLEEAKAAAEKKKQKGTWPQKPHHGLYNQGATCYLNSVLQVLFMTPEIHDRLDPKSKITDQELKNIFKKLKETTCGTENITQCLEIQNKNQQGDAAECLEMILHKVSPQASEVFEGQLTYIIKCNEGHCINKETNPFWTLPLPLKDTHGTNYSVEKNLKRIFRTKSFGGDNMVYCNECGKNTEATKGCEMVEAPQILTVLLKRFDFDYKTMSHVKSDCCVDVPLVLQTKGKKYKLYAMVNHRGGLEGGHYTATILSNEDKAWYECNDAHVHKVKEQPFAKNKTYNSRTACLIVYRASCLSLRDEVQERQDETGHQDEQRGRKKEHKRRFSEGEADDEEQRLNKERQPRRTRSLQRRGEEGDAKREKRVSSFNRATLEDDVLLPQKQNASNSSKQHPDKWTKADKREQRSKKQEDETSLQLCGRPLGIKRNPFLIGLIGFGAALIVIFIVLMTTLNRS